MYLRNEVLASVTRHPDNDNCVEVISFHNTAAVKASNLLRLVTPDVVLDCKVHTRKWHRCGIDMYSVIIVS